MSGHILGELGLAVSRCGDELHGDAAIVDELHIPGTDVLRASVLASWADTLTGILAISNLTPHVPVTLGLDLHLYHPPASIARVHAAARRVKVGRSVVVAAVDFTAGDGTPLAASTGMFMASPNRGLTMPEGFDPVDALAVPRGPLTMPLAARAGCERRSPGVAELPRSDEGLNASGTVNGGLLALAIEEAALSARPGATLAMMGLHYLRPVRVGPAVATAVPHAGVAEVTVVDRGRDDAVAIVATTRYFGAP